MQLTGGQYKGRKIITPKIVRPTLAVARESVFNILNSHFDSFEGKKFLDMFLGSSIMSFEALSRGFDVSAYEISLDIIKNARENAKNLNVDIKISRTDAFRAISKTDEKFDVIYADPPWSFSYEKIFKSCASILSEDGILIVEYDKKKKPNITQELVSEGTLELFKEKNYGRCCLLFLKLK